MMGWKQLFIVGMINEGIMVLSLPVHEQLEQLPSCPELRICDLQT